VTRVLTHEEARGFYDRFGRRQDSQRFYEDAALKVLIEHARFGAAHSVFEFGCGTGWLAEALLDRHLPGTARYVAVDVSSTMIELTRRRLERFADRVDVLRTKGDMKLELPDNAFDRFVSTYVLDLLSVEDIELLLQEAHRILKPGGLLALTSLTHGCTTAARFVEKMWVAVHALRPSLVGGCRPVALQQFVWQPKWQTRYHQRVTQFAISSEILVAAKPSG
jgi:ubiquinone/menaquinone biosynthesis C-methylase UbiE